jgi:hypothetical protein
VAGEGPQMSQTSVPLSPFPRKLKCILYHCLKRARACQRSRHKLFGVPAHFSRAAFSVGNGQPSLFARSRTID